MHANNRGVESYSTGSDVDDSMRLAAIGLFSSISIFFYGIGFCDSERSFAADRPNIDWEYDSESVREYVAVHIVREHTKT
jgi:hypothetical protein